MIFECDEIVKVIRIYRYIVELSKVTSAIQYVIPWRSCLPRGMNFYNNIEAEL